MKKHLFFFILILLCFLISSCDKKDDLISSNQEEELTVTMPRPKGWLLGTWTATMNRYLQGGVESAFAGKKIKLVLTKEHTLNIGYWYEGQLIFDDGSPNAVTFNLKSPAEQPANYIEWIYDKAYDIENLYLEVKKNGNNYIKLTTTNLGTKGISPVTISFDWEININGIYESAYFFSPIVFVKQ
ncbi:MAG: hypothetical protein QHH13_01620 [Melioribacter sp.]|uniref:hypothetical protein n=1 Tax=Rosettibacter primus TaxID=3111523 RepID=UPI00247D2B19|nr:hypothetical protein [Melioribacter sp.]